MDTSTPRRPTEEEIIEDGTMMHAGGRGTEYLIMAAGHVLELEQIGRLSKLTREKMVREIMMVGRGQLNPATVKKLVDQIFEERYG